MSCARCAGKEDTFKVSITPNIHEGLCMPCGSEWTEHALATALWRNPLGTWAPAFRRWCESWKKAAA